MRHRSYRRLNPAQRLQALALREQGLNYAAIGRELGFRSLSVLNALIIEPALAAEPVVVWEPGGRRLCLAEREEISRGLCEGLTYTAIAAGLGRSTSTVSREVAANGGRGDYRAFAAHHRAHEAARRPKCPKLANPALAGQVASWLEEWWSPQEIAQRLRLEHPDDPMMWVSHETIYQSLYVQGRGELRRELHRCLRSGRARRRPQGRLETRGKIIDMVMISERPAEVADRAVPGHWEGDLIIGKNGASAVGTLVERFTRYLLLLHLPGAHTAAEVEAAMKAAIATLPAQMFKTITWDQGKEMARHASFSIDTGIQVYFCDPHSPWQRGSNENTNGLLRQYMPKGTDLSAHSAEDLARFSASLNNRPRKTLGYMKPSEKLAELLATTA